ncbi:MAG: FlgD immunoglobulin-like domain containing protein [Clostridia bacterium]|nr:FlgD immunoglobulin-like domain containing protein [Clostridia bacterium]
MVNLFAGSDYKIITSSGAEEDSWFWAGQEGRGGAGYFSDALLSGMSSRGSFGADENSDGAITLTELQRYLRSHHGASTPHTYPEEDDFVLFRYDRAQLTPSRRGIAGQYLFPSDLLEGLIPEAEFSYTLFRPARIGYQLTFQKNGGWDFAASRFFWDNSERYGPYGDAEGYLTPGRKQRRVRLTGILANAGGYALLQILQADDDGQASILTSHVFAVSTDSDLSGSTITLPERFAPAGGEELCFNILHAAPCEITVTIRDEQGGTVRRLATRRASRPEQLGGSSFCWTGRLADGTLAEPGAYTIHAVLYDKDGQFQVDSVPFLLE